VKEVERDARNWEDRNKQVNEMSMMTMVMMMLLLSDLISSLTNCACKDLGNEMNEEGGRAKLLFPYQKERQDTKLPPYTLPQHTVNRTGFVGCPSHRL